MTDARKKAHEAINRLERVPCRDVADEAHAALDRAVEKARRAHGAMCKECGPIQTVDEDGCCPMCGIDAIICAWHQGTTIAERVGTQDGSFIVRACNSHDALVEALKATIEELELLADSLSLPAMGSTVSRFNRGPCRLGGFREGSR